MSEFRITITHEACVRASRTGWQRMTDLIEREGPEIVGHQNFAENSWTYRGEASSAVITVLQAAARGDDLEAVLELLAPTEETRK